MNTRRAATVAALVAVAAALVMGGYRIVPLHHLGLSRFLRPTATSTASSPVASPLTSMETALEQVYARVNPSVVAVRVIQKQSRDESPVPGMRGFPYFGLPPMSGQPQQRRRQAEGSGFVWDTQGHIVTNNHVVTGADRIDVAFSDGTVIRGKVVGADPNSDLAVVKVDVPAARLRAVQIGDSTQLHVGQLAIAIGNPFGEQNTMTTGIVSALGRSLPATDGAAPGPTYTIPDVIQTDAPINPGNSGGVLLDANGWVIGVTSAIESPSGTSAGIGFAIPSAIVQKVVPVLIQRGRYDHPWLGISGVSLNPDLATAMGLEANQRGVLVIDVMSGSPAARAGLHGSDRDAMVDGLKARVGGDVIITIDAQPIRRFDDLVAYLARDTSVGQPVTLAVLRQGHQETMAVTLAERPSAPGR